MYKASPSPHFKTAKEMVDTISPEARQVLFHLLLRQDDEGKEPLLKPGDDHPATKTYLRSKGKWEFPTENFALLASITHWLKYYPSHETLAVIFNLPLSETETLQANLRRHPEYQVLTEPTPPGHLLTALTPPAEEKAAEKEDTFPTHPADGLDFDAPSEEVDEPATSSTPHALSGISWMNPPAAIDNDNNKKFRWAS